MILEEDSTDTIEEVMARQGTDPRTGLIEKYRTVRNALDPSATVPDPTGVDVYVIAVPVGSEKASAAAYAADPAVYAAGVDRTSIGTVTPDTALPSGSMVPATLGVTAVIAGLLASLLVIAGRHVRR